LRLATEVSANFIFFSLQRSGRPEGSFSDLFLRFRNRYLEKTGDRQIPEVAAPYFAFRGLVMVSPVWYPNLSEILSRRLMAFIVAVLERSAFDPREAWGRWGRARVRLAQTGVYARCSL
jgi:hypothetical protein